MKPCALTRYLDHQQSGYCTGDRDTHYSFPPPEGLPVAGAAVKLHQIQRKARHHDSHPQATIAAKGNRTTALNVNRQHQSSKSWMSHRSTRTHSSTKQAPKTQTQPSSNIGCFVLDLSLPLTTDQNLMLGLAASDQFLWAWLPSMPLSW